MFTLCWIWAFAKIYPMQCDHVGKTYAIITGDTSLGSGLALLQMFPNDCLNRRLSLI